MVKIRLHEIFNLAVHQLQLRFNAIKAGLQPLQARIHGESLLLTNAALYIILSNVY